jgi:hypothetical protein
MSTIVDYILNMPLLCLLLSKILRYKGKTRNKVILVYLDSDYDSIKNGEYKQYEPFSICRKLVFIVL